MFISVVCCCKQNNTLVCDDHLFGQVSTCTGRYQLHAQMCTREDTLTHYLDAPFIDDVMRHNTLISYLNGR